MTGFVREHWRPLTGATLLHVALLAMFAFAAWNWPREQPEVQLAIEGVAIDARALPNIRARAPEPEPQAAPTPEPVAAEPDPAEQARVEAEETQRAAEAEREAQEREQALLRDAEAARAAEARREAEQQEQLREAEQAKRQAEAAEQARKVREAKQQEAAAAEAKRQAAREAELQRTLAAEEEAAAVARSGVVDEYRRMLTQAIERNWNRPPTARPGLECTLNVTQAPGGTVIDVKVGACNGDAAVRESIMNAVFRASPLPPPPDARAFERRLEIVFKPTE